MWGQATITLPMHTQSWEAGTQKLPLLALVTGKRLVGEGQETEFGPASGRFPELLQDVASCVSWPEWDRPPNPPPSRACPTSCS